MVVVVESCQRPLCLSDTEVAISVQVKLKTRPWPAGRFLFPEADGHERVRLQRASRWLFALDPKKIAGIANDALYCVHRVPRVTRLYHDTPKKCMPVWDVIDTLHEQSNVFRAAGVLCSLPF